MADKLKITKITHGHFADRFNSVSVYEVSGGGFCAFLYQCRLNLDLDGARTAYGYDNPAAKDSLGKDNLQKNLDPLESWHKGMKGVSTATSQKTGLGNACGDPGDGTKGWRNFLNGNRKFYWVGVKALKKADAKAAGFVVDDRPELEAGLDQNYSGYFNKHHKLPDLLPKGSGYFPVVQNGGSDGAGYYISTTSVAADGDASVYDAGHYLDSSSVPYAVWANEWSVHASSCGSRLSQGDYGIAIRTSTGANTAYVYGDSGTAHKVGESSKKLHDALGYPNDPVTFIAFPGSGTGKVVGKNPQNVIRQNVLSRTVPLGDNASDLAIFLATGHVNPKTPLKMTTAQARMYNNTCAALAPWTNVVPATVMKLLAAFGAI